MATVRITLSNNSKLSREITEKRTALCVKFTFNANKVSELAVSKKNNNNNAPPRSLSTAKACTEVNTPERTINVPSKLKAKANRENKIVQ